MTAPRGRCRVPILLVDGHERDLVLGVPLLLKRRGRGVKVDHLTGGEESRRQFAKTLASKKGPQRTPKLTLGQG